jgi:mannose-6-phosphate isomerase-like protein (cupin superfamily)
MENSCNPAKCVKTLIHTADARVAEYVMGPESGGVVHYHSVVSEHCVCLRGNLQVKVGGGSVHSLRPGDKLEIPAGVSHQIINPGKNSCQYLVVQSGGAYDFITVQVAP